MSKRAETGKGRPLLFLLPAIICIILATCRESPSNAVALPPPPNRGSIRIEVQYEDFTEILLKITAGDTLSGTKKEFALKRNGELILYESFRGKDTTIADTQLASNTPYSYEVLLLHGNNAVDSMAIQGKTRAYGSNDWNFSIDTLGEYNSIARSVYSFAKNDAWIAGDFLKYNSPNESPPYYMYGVMHWDGNTWSSVSMYNRLGILSVHGFTICGGNPSDIWLLGDDCFRYNGTSWNIIPNLIAPFNGATFAAYAFRQNDIYFVGDGGAIAHWGGNKVSQIPSPTNCNLLDIHGDEGILYAAGNSLDNGRSAVIKIADGRAAIVDTMLRSTGYSTLSVWFKQRDSVMAFGGEDNRIVCRNRTLRPLKYAGQIPLTTKVKGTGIDNIWFVGHHLSLMHYNGAAWNKFPDVEVGGSSQGILYSLDVHEDYMFAAGFVVLQNGEIRAIVVRGYRR